MDEHQSGTETLSSAESAFIEFLSRRGTEEGIDFEDFCAERRPIEPQLRDLYREWARLDRLISAGADSDTLKRRLEREFGASLDDGVSLQGDTLDRESAGEIVRRLSEHSPQVSRYAPRGQITEGGMGTILKVWDQDLRRNLVMKVARTRRHGQTPDARHDMKVLGRFLEEAQITGQLDHPGIVPVHELGLDAEGRVYFTMPLVQGRELKEIFQLARAGKEGWDRRRALAVMLKVCEAVAYAHSKGVIHRDLKPSNVMVGRFGETYVIDWGLARVIGRRDAHDIRLRDAASPATVLISTDRSSAKDSTPGSPLVTHDDDIIGTPAFMSPEQARGQIEELGPTSDIYSLGAMLYQLLTGEMPYARTAHSSTPHVLLTKLLEGPPEPVRRVAPDTPEELASICDKAMAREPGGRYQNALDLARDLEAYLGLRPVAAREPSLAYVGRLFLQRNRAAVLATAAALVLLAIWGAIYLGQRAADRAARQRLTDVDAGQVLLQEAEQLYPAVPATVPAIDRWTARTQDLLARAPEYRRAPEGDVEIAGLVADIGRLEALLPRVLERRASALALSQRTIESQREAWNRATASILDSAVYGHMTLKPQLGLVPLQQNPETGLWEFWLEPTGTAPEIADPGTGRLAMGADSAVVLVLLPGGVFTMGPSDDELIIGRYHKCDKQHEVRVEPCFVSKYETTQGQWTRLMERNLARYQPGTLDRPERDEPLPGDTYTAVNPEESVTFFESSRFAERAGCRLPTEEEWEYACRAGTRTRFSWGSFEEDLEGNENIADQSQIGTGSVFESQVAPWNDGYITHAPVGTFRSNPFGLYDMHGNVSEWVETVYDDCYGKGPQLEQRVFRGGSWYVPYDWASSYFRSHDIPRGVNQARGFRIARSLDR